MIRRVAVVLVILGLVAATYFWGSRYVRDHPEEFPWTELSLTDPVGRFTLAKLAALADDPAQCRALLEAVRSADVAAPARRASSDCGYEDGVYLSSGEDDAGWSPGGTVTSCPLAAALYLWERDVLQPASADIFGDRVASIQHAGSYSCRRLYGRSEGDFSEHATADAIDVTGFTLDDGTRLSVLRDWDAGDKRSAFLRRVRDKGCDLFSTALSPDYNAAHADHFHLDMAERGRRGFSVCR